MEKEKQIEEMARALRRDGKDCESTQCLLCHNSKHCFERKLAEEVISKGYRKASEVAEEIIRILRAAGINEHRYPVIAKLKKKYIEEKGDGKGKAD